MMIYFALIASEKLSIRYEYLFKADKIRFKAVFKESRYLNAFFEMFCLAVNWEVRNTEGLCSKSKSHQPFDIMHRRNNDLVMVIYVVEGKKWTHYNPM